MIVIQTGEGVGNRYIFSGVNNKGSISDTSLVHFFLKNGFAVARYDVRGSYCSELLTCNRCDYINSDVIVPFPDAFDLKSTLPSDDDIKYLTNHNCVYSPERIQASWSSAVDDFVTVYQFASKLSDIDFSRAGVFGHSEGGLVIAKAIHEGLINPKIVGILATPLVNIKESREITTAISQVERIVKSLEKCPDCPRAMKLTPAIVENDKININKRSIILGSIDEKIIKKETTSLILENKRPIEMQIQAIKEDLLGWLKNYQGSDCLPIGGLNAVLSGKNLYINSGPLYLSERNCERASTLSMLKDYENPVLYYLALNDSSVAFAKEITALTNEDLSNNLNLNIVVFPGVDHNMLSDSLDEQSNSYEEKASLSFLNQEVNSKIVNDVTKFMNSDTSLHVHDEPSVKIDGKSTYKGVSKSGYQTIDGVVEVDCTQVSQKKRCSVTVSKIN